MKKKASEDTLTQPQRRFKENRKKHAEDMLKYFHKNKAPRQNSLRTVRLARGLTQEQLARQLKVNRKTIIRIERQEQNVNPRLAEEIGGILNAIPSKIFPKSALGRLRKRRSHGKKENG